MELTEVEVSDQPTVGVFSLGWCSRFDTFVVTQWGVGLCRVFSHQAKVFRLRCGVEASKNTPFLSYVAG